ncbi:hypothetical protein I4U23_022279 [Adineta vaga]|nr:hypothetical protein I4U23_022279 [Adineta vaga]
MCRIGFGPDELNTPWGYALDTNSGKFYVSDQYNHRIVQYQIGFFNGTIVGGGNRIYFDSLSKSLYISNFGTTSWTLIAGSMIATSGSTSNLLYYPSDVTLDASGNVYVADTYNQGGKSGS